MSDGAHLGYGAEAAVHAVLGGAQPEHLETAEEMRDRIMATTVEEAHGTYDGCATYMAKIILTAFTLQPELAQVPTEPVYETDDDGRMRFVDGNPVVVHPGLYEVLKQRITADDRDVAKEMSGFQWGWAVNAARRCVELGPVPNPAIVTINGIGDDDG